MIGHGVGAVLGIAGLVWGSSTIQHQIQLQVATVRTFEDEIIDHLIIMLITTID